MASMQRYVALFLALTAVATLLATVSVAPIEEDTVPVELDYWFQNGYKQPPSHIAQRSYDPMARDGYSRRGSFFAERRLFHKLGDKFYMIVTGTHGHHIRCTVRGYKMWRGQYEYVGYKKTWTGRNVVMSNLLPALKSDEKDTLTCNDLLTGERRYWIIDPVDREKEDHISVDNAQDGAFEKWLHEHGLEDFQEGPLHGTSGAAKDMVPDKNGDTPGEKWLWDKGLPPVYFPKYQSEQHDMYRVRQSDVLDMSASDLRAYRREVENDLAYSRDAVAAKREQHDDHDSFADALDMNHPATSGPDDQFSYDEAA